MKRTFAVIVIMLVTTVGQAFAAPVKIGVVDLQKAVSQCKSGIAARAELLKKTEELNSELRILKADFEKSRAEFEKDTARLTDESRSDKEKHLLKMSRDLQNRQRDAQEEVKQLESDYLKKVVNRLGLVLGKIGDEGTFSAILDKNAGVFYTGKEIDITPLLVKRADEEYGKQ
ncbi:MAG: outer membrane [Geobacteraceae bacterium]|nr:MAG: outer membrane [Geobacteraceae bacterium]